MNHDAMQGRKHIRDRRSENKELGLIRSKNEGLGEPLRVTLSCAREPCCVHADCDDNEWSLDV